MPRQPTPALHDAAWGARAALGREVSARQPRALPGGHWALHNARTGLEGFVSRVGLEADDGSGAPIRLSLRRWGRERSETPVEIATVTLGGCAPAWETDARGDCRRQVALHRPDLVETWESGPDGLLHAFRLLPPPGDGAVLLHIGVEGAAPQPTGPDEVWLQEADRAWRYAGLAAWDERGAPLPARMEVAGDEIVLRVDAPPGAGWISVDPALTDGAVWRDAPADEPRAQFGMAVAGVGDVDGDGYDDVMVGAPYLDAQVVDQGRLFLYRGGPTGLSDRASQTFDSPTLYYALFGLSFAAAGDVNGDGMGDVIVGAPYANDDVADEGMVWLYLGSPGGLVSPPAWSQSPANQGAAHTGVSVASAGDVNGDGFDDVLVGSPRFSAQAQDEGRAWLYLGSPSGLEPTPAWVADPTDQAYAQFGGAVSAAGDVNADGYGDVVISAVNFNGQERQEGRAYLYLGGPAGLQASPAWSRDPTDVYNCLFGQELASAGDVDGDGHDDVVICGCVDEPRYGKEGAAYLYHGDTAGLLNRYSWLEHPSNDSGFDYCDSVDRAGDVNGDGFGDVIVGASSYAGDVGEAWLYLGSAGGLATAEAWRLAAGDAVASAGDVNGDGYGDVIIGDATYSRPGAVSAGRAALFLGCPGTQEVAGDLVDQDCDGAILCYHDADGDGFSVAGTPVVLSSNLSCSDPGEALQRPREGDCDDSSAAAHPGGLELPGNEVDEDCDGAVVCVWDEDGDGYAPVPWGTIPSQDMDCRDPYELITPGAAADCDDRDAGRHPGATEQPLNDLDDDCDGQVACFRDADGDGSPSARPSLADGGSCAELGLSVQPGSAPDCDDADPAVHPGAAEAVGTEQDTNCDGLLLCYADPDHDGFTLAAPGAEPSLDGDCDDPGEAATPSAASDCAEGDPAIHPGASETPGDEVDEDCDGRVLCATDADADGHAVAVPLLSLDADCGDPGEAIAPGAPADCDDSRATIFPGAVEVAGNELDEDCDGGLLCVADADADGATGGGTAPSADLDCRDAGEAVTPSAALDCDDHRADVGPTMTERAGDEVDDDCDGELLCLLDGDGDGAASADVVVSGDLDCADAGEATAAAPVDCDDRDPLAHPGAQEIAGNGADDDCDGLWGCATDADADGYLADDGVMVEASACPVGTVADAAGEDCDDAAADVFPGAVDTPGDRIDQDCDGVDAAAGGGDGDEHQGGRGGCACDASGSPPSWALLAAIGLGSRRRTSQRGRRP